MKKILSLLSVLTISGTAMPSAIAANKYEKEETINKTNINYQQQNKIETLIRKKRQTPPSLQNIITTVNIGEIEINDQEHIITTLREINHPILSRPEFLANIVIENITPNSALIYTRTNIQTEQFLLPSSIKFTINFITQRPLFSTVITNRNLGTISDNTLISINCRVLELNPNIKNWQNIVPLEKSTTGGLLVLRRSVYNRNHFTFDKPITITYNAQRYDLSSTILNTDLGELPDNSPQTILQRVVELNPNVNINYLQVEEITENSADIFSQNNGIYFGYQTVHFILQQNYQTNKENKIKLVDEKINNNKSNCQPITPIVSSVLAGTGAGAAAGAIGGSAVPGFGTVIGGFTGALVGGITSIASVKLICNK